MPEFLCLSEAVERFIKPGCSLAPEGFTHLIPFATCHEIIRQGVTDLTLIRLTPDIVSDQLVGMGCIQRLVFGWLGNPGVGSLYRIRDAIEYGWPHPLELDERSLAALTTAYSAGAAGMPLGLLRGCVGTGLEAINPNLRFVECPFSGERLAAVAAINPDVAVLHAQRADREGNVHLWGITGVQKEIALAAKHVLVSVEEIVPRLDSRLNDCLLPYWIVTAICEVPGGAFPSYAHGYYGRDNSFYSEWSKVSRSREKFRLWMQEHVLETRDNAEYLALMDQNRKLTVR